MKSKWSVLSKCILSAALSIAALLGIIMFTYENAGYYDMLEWIKEWIFLAAIALFMLYAVLRGVSANGGSAPWMTARTVKGLYLAAVGLAACSYLLFTNWLPFALCVLLLLCIIVPIQYRKPLRRIGNLLMLAVTLYTVACVIVPIFSSLSSVDFVQFGLFVILRWSFQLSLPSITFLLLELSAWLLLPTALMSRLPADTVSAHDMQVQLLQLKDEYEIGYISQQEYERIQTTVLDQI